MKRLSGPFVVTFLLVAMVVAGCSAGSDSAATSSPTAMPWIEEEITFSFGSDELFGVLTMPADEGPHPAVVLISGSGGAATGIRANTSTREFIDHSHRLALEGFAVLRYDPPGVGRSTGEPGLPSMERRTEETAAAIRYLGSRPEIRPDAVGLQGWSQGPWVTAMTAARYPDDVAFLVSVVGSGQTVAEQQVYGIEAQSRAAGMTEEDVAKAVLFGRLLIDWQLIDPIFQEGNLAAAEQLGVGPWTPFMELVYEPAGIGPVEGLAVGIEIMKSVQDEPWTKALYLQELYIPRLESVPADISPEDLAAIQAVSARSLLTDPKDFLTEVRVPVLAIFGEDDLNVDSEKSPALYERYLTEAGNPDFTIVVMPGVGHGIGAATPGYWDILLEWLTSRYLE
jgi:hypothetical protein